ncbi:FtsB family cell division protein [Mucilaginibacter psychrotolerans]|uniref:Septum formation initiator family protein n=1 Tax=Mucilaginibacter psychrotolerans TaxID=1524096 RepID=A0A4Y8SJQ9_9SPHI|nr:septum formation initiator family protein [Mucilaginibacter psychrotolerans]TFF38885.1 septum formation initiator family protein [Mucilaginibacter psychrotolerans]
MKRFINLIKNKYFLITVIFVVWMIFFDNNDIFSQYQYRQQLAKLEQERDFYKAETARINKDFAELSTDKTKLEKFGREKYFMKKDNEDVFVIEHPKKD